MDAARTSVIRGNEPAYLPSEHEEAWSRLLYAVDHQRTLMLLTGAAGVGKSHLLRRLIESTSLTSGRSLLLLDACGLTEAELVSHLDEACGGFADEPPWQAIGDRLYGLGATKLPAVWIIDHLDQASEDLTLAVRRLLRWIERTHSPVTLIVAGRTSQQLAPLADLAELWGDLPAWGSEATFEFLEQWAEHQQTGQEPVSLSPEAGHAIYDCTQGVAGRILRLCELCELAARLRDDATIDVELVLQVWTEFCVPGNSQPSRHS